MTINDVLINIENGVYYSSNFMNPALFCEESGRREKKFQKHLSLALEDKYNISKKVADMIVNYAFDDNIHDGYYAVVICAENYAEIVVKCLEIS